MSFDYSSACHIVKVSIRTILHLKEFLIKTSLFQKIYLFFKVNINANSKAHAKRKQKNEKANKYLAKIKNLKIIIIN